MQKRVIGFDLLRSYAIILVICKHSVILLPKNFDFFFSFLPDPVDIFFVLSGFLIGNLFIRDFFFENAIHKINFKSIFLFIKKRWFRTLPNYYLFLGINIILVYFSLIPGSINQFTFTYFIFCQNLFFQFDIFFWESWSLAVEEWFYILFPIIFLIIHKIKKVNPKVAYLCVCILLIGIALIYKCFALKMNLNTELFIRKIILSRLDTISVGLISAFLFNFYFKYWNSYTKPFFVLGTLSYFSIKHFTINPIIIYSINSVSIALILPTFMHLKLDTSRAKIVTFLSNTSYSAYLTHLILFNLILHFFSLNSVFLNVTIFICYLITTFFLSYLVYKFFQTPIIKYRNKHLS
jgi:peptidoglycan/LPS O-acetylase OafA/YrhL